MHIRKKTSDWIRVAFINLLLVASLGVLMRYKIAFALPFVDQKHLLHAHSHFAFAGWVTQALMMLLIYCLSLQKQDLSFKKYKWLLLANLITAYGMLLSFPFQGYGPVSIAFSTFSIVVSYIFAIVFWKDLNSIPSIISHYWLKAALIFSVLSSAGTFALSSMMVTKSVHQDWYLGAIYFYLHFQYNGWFFFACMGLFSYLTKDVLSKRIQEMVFGLFTFACIPAYILSVLWMSLPEWIHAIVSIAAALQVAAWILLLSEIWKSRKLITQVYGKGKWVLILSAVAVSIKLLLQLGSTVHFLSDLAFSFRPIVVGYLHLVLLGVITLFIIGYSMAENLVPDNRKIKWGIVIFIAGIILNEVLLMLQGISGMAYILVPFINEMLLLAALIMFSGILLVNIGDWEQISQTNYYS